MSLERVFGARATICQPLDKKGLMQIASAKPADKTSKNLERQRVLSIWSKSTKDKMLACY
jgi:hypothetical protein